MITQAVLGPKSSRSKGKIRSGKNAMYSSNQHSDTYTIPRLMKVNSFDVNDPMTSGAEVSKRTNRVGPSQSPIVASGDSDIVLNQAEYSY